MELMQIIILSKISVPYVVLKAVHSFDFVVGIKLIHKSIQTRTYPSSFSLYFPQSVAKGTFKRHALVSILHR